MGCSWSAKHEGVRTPGLVDECGVCEEATASTRSDVVSVDTMMSDASSAHKTLRAAREEPGRSQEQEGGHPTATRVEGREHCRHAEDELDRLGGIVEMSLVHLGRHASVSTVCPRRQGRLFRRQGEAGRPILLPNTTWRWSCCSGH